jgi:hypothetical protein
MSAMHHPAGTEPVPAPRRRRWWVGATLLVLLLGIYAAALTWTTRRLETDIQKSIHPLPTTDVAHRAGE